MENKDDLFYKFILLYRQFMSYDFDFDFAPIFGNFFRNSKNIISSFSLEEFEKNIDAVIHPYYIEGSDGIKLLEIQCKSYIIPGAIQKNETIQAIPFSDECDPEKVSPFNWRICLVAYDNPDSYRGGIYTIENYKFGYEVYSINALGHNYTQKLGYNVATNQLATNYIPLDLKRDFKRAFKVPFHALPKKRDDYCYRPIPLINYNWEQATGIGTYSAYRKDFQLRCIDIDGCVFDEFIDSFLEKLNLPIDYEWVIRTGSGEGFHIWVWCEDLPSGLLLKGDSKHILEQSGVILFHPNDRYKYTFKVLEVRWNAFCILPPSRSVSGSKYSFRHKLPRTGIIKIDPKTLFDAIDVVGENTTIDYTNIIRHNGYWSDNEDVRTIFMCLDVETDGLPKDYNKPFTDKDNWPHIVQISYVLFNIINGEIHKLTEQDFILSPNDSYIIPPNMIHGITNEKANKDGFRRHDVLKFIANQLDYVDYIVGHNISFDINVLRCEFEREKIDVSNQFDYIQLICTMKTASQLYPKGSPWPKLERLYQDLTREKMTGAHNALSDVYATVKCFEILLKRRLINVKTSIRWGDTYALRSNY